MKTLKKLIVAILLLGIGVTGYSQTNQVVGQTVQATKNLLPPIDTVLAPLRLGEIRVKVSGADTVIFIAVSTTGPKKWQIHAPFSAGDGITVTSGAGGKAVKWGGTINSTVTMAANANVNWDQPGSSAGRWVYRRNGAASGANGRATWGWGGTNAQLWNLYLELPDTATAAQPDAGMAVFSFIPFEDAEPANKREMAKWEFMKSDGSQLTGRKTAFRAFPKSGNINNTVPWISYKNNGIVIIAEDIGGFDPTNLNDKFHVRGNINIKDSIKIGKMAPVGGTTDSSVVYNRATGLLEVKKITVNLSDTLVVVNTGSGETIASSNAAGDTLNIKKINDGIGTDAVTSGSAIQINTVNNTYAPTFFAITNLDGTPTVLGSTFTYDRIGDKVRVEGWVSVDPTAASNYEFDISVPIASALTSKYQGGGVAMDDQQLGQTYSIEVNPTNDRMKVKAGGSGTGARDIVVIFWYKLL